MKLTNVVIEVDSVKWRVIEAMCMNDARQAIVWARVRGSNSCTHSETRNGEVTAYGKVARFKEENEAVPEYAEPKIVIDLETSKGMHVAVIGYGKSQMQALALAAMNAQIVFAKTVEVMNNNKLTFDELALTLKRYEPQPVPGFNHSYSKSKGDKKRARAALRRQWGLK